MNDLQEMISSQQELMDKIDCQRETIERLQARNEVLEARSARLFAEVTLLKMILKEAATNPAGKYYFGLHCGIEDNELMDRYEAADYGWDSAFEYVQSIAESTDKQEVKK